MINKISLDYLKITENWSKAVIVFTADSFNKPYSVESRSYLVSRDNKFFQKSKCGNSLFGDCLDGSEDAIRLDWYIYNCDGKSWKIDYCYIIE